jgi:type I restriction enzyme R subunit
MLHGFDYAAVVRGPAAGRMAGIAAAMDFILGLDDGKKRYLQAATELSKAFALSVPHQAALAIRDQVGFFQAIRAGLVKLGGGGGGGGGGSGGDEPPEDLDTAIRQIVSKAVASDRVVDIFAAAGLQKPDISILSDEFLAEVKELPHRNLALELLRKLLNDEIKVCSARNIVQGRSFAQMLEESIRKYQNRSIETAEVIAELVNLAKEIRDAHKRGEELGLSDDEIAFYDALEVNDSAVKVLGEPTLKKIAQELVEAVRRSVTIDWTVRESARASIRVIVRRILRRYGYPPDKQEQATLLVLEQAEVLCRDWAA